MIERAEALFAEFGIDGASLRQIGVAIGSANTNVVTYHFGDKAALIEAIYRHRLPALEQRRAELLTDAEHSGKDDNLAVLVHALWQPLFEQTDSHGRHSYAGFLAALSRSDWGWTRRSLHQDYPVTSAITDRMARLLDVDGVAFDRRIQINAMIVVSALRMIDEGCAPADGPVARSVFGDALRMATAALAAPYATT